MPQLEQLPPWYIQPSGGLGQLGGFKQPVGVGYLVAVGVGVTGVGVGVGVGVVGPVTASDKVFRPTRPVLLLLNTAPTE